MTNFELKNKLNNLNMTEEEINCVVKQYEILGSYVSKSAELDAYESSLMDEISCLDDDESKTVEELYDAKQQLAEDVNLKVSSKRNELITDEEEALHRYYCNEKANLIFDYETLKLVAEKVGAISGIFLLYKLERWNKSRSPRLAKFIYFEGNNPIIFELECANADPKLITKEFENNKIFINSFFKNFVSLYLQMLVSEAYTVEGCFITKYCYDELGFVDNDYENFYSSKIIGKRSAEDSYLVGEFTNYVSEKGTFDDYMAMLKKEVKTPRLQLALTFGVMSPINYMLHELNSDINNVVINICGMSSKGKTTVQKLATSVFAKPEIGPYGLFLNSNSTLLAMVRSFANCNGMLFGIDDLTRFSKANNINMETLIYTLEAGQSKTVCGSTGTVRKPVEFHGTVITSSERFLADNTFKEGASVRINEMNLDYWTNSADNSENICRAIADNYGLLGPKFMEYLMGAYSKEQIYGIYRKKVKVLEKSANSYSEFNRRIINKLAIILVSAELLKEYFDKNTDYKFNYKKVQTLLIELFNDMLVRSNDPKVILRDIVAFYNKFKRNFSINAENEFQTFGRIVEVNGEPCLALTKNGKEAFKKNFYDLNNAKLTALFNANYLESEIDHEKSNSNYSKRVSFSKTMLRCTVIKIDNFND